jgi:uncharacterized repeat protein (TIGR01451 family)
VLRRRLFGSLMLLGAVLALPGVARSQAAATPSERVPGPTPPGLDALATPLLPEAPPPTPRPTVARKVIATSQSSAPPSPSSIPVPDDGLTPGNRRPVMPAPAVSSSAVRNAGYRQDVDGGTIQQVGGSDSRPAKKGEPAPVQIAAGARLDLHVEAPPAITAGKAFRYLIHVKSTGMRPATSVRVTDHMPAGVRLINAEPKPEVAGDRLTWDLGDLPPGTERLIQVAMDAERLATDFVVSPVASFGVAPEVKVSAVRPKLEIHLTGPDSALPGAVVPFRVHVANNSTISMPRVRILVKMSPGLRHPRMSRDNAIEAEIALAPGESKTLPLDLQANTLGQNDIAVFASSDDNVLGTTASIRVDPTAGTATAAAFRAVPRLRVEINNLSDAINVGGSILYEVKVQNPEDAPQMGIRLLASLTEGLEPDQADGPTASTVTAHGVVFDTLRRLAPGESAVFHVRARGKRAGVQQLRVEVNADHLGQPATAEVNTWVAPGRGR